MKQITFRLMRTFGRADSPSKVLLHNGSPYLELATVVKGTHPENGVDLTLVKLGGESDGAAGDQYTGLDQFCRIANQRWVNGSGASVDRYL